MIIDHFIFWIESSKSVAKMIEIPLSSVIIQNQPNSDENESQNPQNESTDEPTMIGLGPLRTANKLWIKQRIRASDILSNLTGCEVKNEISLLGCTYS